VTDYTGSCGPCASQLSWPRGDSVNARRAQLSDEELRDYSDADGAPNPGADGVPVPPYPASGARPCPGRTATGSSATSASASLPRSARGHFPLPQTMIVTLGRLPTN